MDFWDRQRPEPWEGNVRPGIHNSTRSDRYDAAMPFTILYVRTNSLLSPEQEASRVE